MYEVGRTQYLKLLQDNASKHYKTAPDGLCEEINITAKSLAENLNIADRVDTLAKSDAYIKLKDQKDNFERNIPCRLINPAKSEIGRISKNMLNSILTTVREKTGVNQWRSTDEALNWFDGLSNNTNLTFLTFDIVEFYPSITETILRKALEFAQEHTTIKDIKIDAILNARQTLMFTKGKNVEQKKRQQLLRRSNGEL